VQARHKHMPLAAQGMHALKVRDGKVKTAPATLTALLPCFAALANPPASQGQLSQPIAAAACTRKKLVRKRNYLQHHMQKACRMPYPRCLRTTQFASVPVWPCTGRMRHQDPGSTSLELQRWPCHWQRQLQMRQLSYQGLREAERQRTMMAVDRMCRSTQSQPGPESTRPGPAWSQSR
jgi:hypothetical protein